MDAKRTASPFTPAPSPSRADGEERRARRLTSFRFCIFGDYVDRIGHIVHRLGIKGVIDDEHTETDKEKYDRHQKNSFAGRLRQHTGIGVAIRLFIDFGAWVRID